MRAVLTTLVVLVIGAIAVLFWPREPDFDPALDAELTARLVEDLTQRGFTGRIEETLEERLGRPIDGELAEVGRLLFFDPILSLTQDNSCSGCHGPNVAFNDSRPIAIGVGNNGVVGPGRSGPFNQRRAPTLINAAFFPRLMWDSRFAATSNDPFRNDAGFTFPEPEGGSLSHMEHLLAAQAFTPTVNRVEMAGPDFAGTNDEMRDEVVRRVDAIAEYRRLFSAVFPEIGAGEALRYEHIARALAEFQFTLVRADAPVDAFARGDTDALTTDQKAGGVIFFDFEGCGECHIVRGYANEMFSDFDNHVLAVPQIVPRVKNVPFDGPGGDEDYGVEQQSGLPGDRYKFRTSPIRNAAYQPSYMHNGAYLCLEDAIRHHLEAADMVAAYSPDHLAPELRAEMGPYEEMLPLLLDLVSRPLQLTEEELRQVVDFVRVGLTDPDASPEALRHLVPASVPSGLPVHDFDFNAPLGGAC